MGCGASQTEKEKRKIKGDFENVGVAKYDEFFEALKKSLEAAEEIRDGLQDAPEEGAEQSECYKLKDYQYVEVVRVCLWTLSCNGGGEIKKCKTSFSAEPPFIDLQYFDGLYLWTRDLWDTIRKWLKACCDAPKNLDRIVKDIADAAEKLKDFNIKDDTSSLGMIEKAKAGKAFASNSAKLVSNAAKVKVLPDLLQKALADLKVIGPQLKDLVGKADETGKPAFAEGLRYPWEVFEKYHKGERKTPAEIEAEDKAVEKRSGKKRRAEKKEEEKEKKAEEKKEKKEEKKEEKKK